MLVDDAVNRMYSILETEPLAETKSGETPKDSSIQLDNAVFAYDNAESNAVDGITMNIKAGEHIAVVGPSGGGKTTLCSPYRTFLGRKERLYKDRRGRREKHSVRGAYEVCFICFPGQQAS